MPARDPADTGPLPARKPRPLGRSILIAASILLLGALCAGLTLRLMLATTPGSEKRPPAISRAGAVRTERRG